MSFFIVFISMILVYLSMHNNYIRMRKYSFRGQHSPGVLNLLKEKQKTAKQATLFVLAFFLTWIIPFVNVILILSNKTVPFCTALIQGLLMPLQGFWNALIYILYCIYQFLINWTNIETCIKFYLLFKKMRNSNN